MPRGGLVRRLRQTQHGGARDAPGFRRVGRLALDFARQPHWALPVAPHRPEGADAARDVAHDPDLHLRSRPAGRHDRRTSPDRVDGSPGRGQAGGSADSQPPGPIPLAAGDALGKHAGDAAPRRAPDPVSADFTDRFLGIFDRGFRSVEGQIDRQADLFDPRSAPAVPKGPGAPDMLSWLAGWIGVVFDRAWPVAKRRRYLMQAAKLYPCRGTLPGLRSALILWLGLDTLDPPRRPARCAPNCAPPPPAWRPPQLILE